MGTTSEQRWQQYWVGFSTFLVHVVIDDDFFSTRLRQLCCCCCRTTQYAWNSIRNLPLNENRTTNGGIGWLCPHTWITVSRLKIKWKCRLCRYKQMKNNIYFFPDGGHKSGERGKRYKGNWRDFSLLSAILLIHPYIVGVVLRRRTFMWICSSDAARTREADCVCVHNISLHICCELCWKPLR